MSAIRHQAVAIFVAAFCSAPLLASEVSEFTIGQSIGVTCAGCHGPEGVSFGKVPSLKGLSAVQIEQSLLQFKNGVVDGSIMSRIAKGYSDSDIAVVADYYGSMN